MKKVHRFNYHNTKKNFVKEEKEGAVKSKKKKNSKFSDSEEEEDYDDEEIPSDFEDEQDKITEKSNTPKAKKGAAKPFDKIEQHVMRVKQEEKEYYDDIKKNRVEQLKQANEDEEKNIKRYETLLKLNKRKRKNGTTSIKSFDDGLDYVLELCTDENIQKMYMAAKEADEDNSEDEFGADLNMALGKSKEKKTKKNEVQEKKTKKKAAGAAVEDPKPESDPKVLKRMAKLKKIEEKYFGDDEDYFKSMEVDSCDGSDSEMGSGSEGEYSENDDNDDNEAPEEFPSKSKSGKKVKFQVEKNPKISDSEDSDFDIEEDSEHSDDGGESMKDENVDSNDGEAEDFGEGSDEEDFGEGSDGEDFGEGSDGEDYGEGSDGDDFGEESGEELKEEESTSHIKKHTADWEDIYGRKRDKDGNFLKENVVKYVPPHMRKTLEADKADIDPKRREKLNSLKKLLKGQINRLAESNLHRITIDVENLYSTNARNDVNSTLTDIIFDSLLSNVLTSERLILEHTILIATLHGNIGSEIGAFFLQKIIEKFHNLFESIDAMEVDNKEIDNVIFIICHLYTFKLFKYTLIYEMLDMLCTKVTEKRIECMLLVLKSIGFVLRKDDPTTLKEFIIKVQKKANTLSSDATTSSRVMFMLDILLAIKNNNMTKIPQYDQSIVEHFRKLLKQFVRAGKYVTTLNISIEDILKADECGKWWLVGSAWAGTDKNDGKNENGNAGEDDVADEQRSKIYALAKKQRMNTDDKKNIFFVLMTAEDYVDAFEKIVSTVKDERSIVAVILHCCLSEKEFNPYYSVLTQKFCEHNRKYLLAIQYTLWDKIKEIESLAIKQIANLARFTIFLIENGSLPLSVLKVIEFNQIEKSTLRFLRQVMLGLLLSEDEKFHQVNLNLNNWFFLKLILIYVHII